MQQKIFHLKLKERRLRNTVDISEMKSRLKNVFVSYCFSLSGGKGLYMNGTTVRDVCLLYSTMSLFQPDWREGSVHEGHNRPWRMPTVQYNGGQQGRAGYTSTLLQAVQICKFTKTSHSTFFLTLGKGRRQEKNSFLRTCLLFPQS